MLNNPTDLVLLNLDLFPTDGINLVREIKTRQQVSPPFAVIYTLKQESFIQELAYEAGADAVIDFHVKPAILKLFIRNLLSRRVRQESNTPPRQLHVDADKHLVFFMGKAIQLPRLEFQLFAFLFNGKDHFFSKEKIAEEIWHNKKVASSRTIDVHIYNIRQVFGKNIIQSKKGKGYRITKKFIQPV